MTIDRAGAAMRGVLKRKFAEVEEEEEEEEEATSYASSSPSSMSSSSSSSSPPPPPPPFVVEWESDGETPLPDAQDPAHPRDPASSAPVCSILKKRRRVDDDGGRRASVSFGAVTVFHFPRCQGFVSVPSHGGASLGMAWNHSGHHSGALDRSEADRLTVDQLPGGSGSMEVPPAEVPWVGGGAGVWSLQPYSYRKRQALLRGAGVKRIDREEKRQLHALRLSREDCGCSCRGFCEPETCACSLAGIRCQMDRSNFPCGCSQDSCGNSQGRSEFNPGRVRTHYLHTAMRMHLERRQLPNTQEDQRQVPGQGGEDHLQGGKDHHHSGGVSAPDDTREDGCPFGFSAEEEGCLLFTSMPATTTSTTSTPSTAFCLIPEPSGVEEARSSSSSGGGGAGGDRMESSSSSSSALDEAEAGGGAPITSPRDHQAQDTSNGTRHSLASLCGLLSALDSQPPPATGPTATTTTPVLLQHLISSTSPPPPASPTSPTPESPLRGARTGVDADRIPSPSSSSSASSTDYLDENANEATDFFGEDSVEGFPQVALFSANYSSSTTSSSYSSSSNGYVDLSVSSDSDLEFFDSDYPLHSSAAKGRGHPADLRHLQVVTSCSLPPYPDTPDCCLLESLIGSSSEPIADVEDAHMVTYSQLLEVLQ
ncbi:hypothetical protein CRUP_015872 [Coryphaenoides rupestris]|nr:hypothetical protein CRUP_015872 [Coryphaenoides rupestris]